MLAIIPARSGSKGLPGKNVRPFLGKPLIAHTIEQALKCGQFDRIIVSTDSAEIAEVSKRYGAEIPFLRPAHLAADTSLGRDVYLHALDHYRQHGQDFRQFTVLQPTSPLRTAADIGNAMQLFNDKKADSVISMVQNVKPLAWIKCLDPASLQILKPPFLSAISEKNRQSEPTYFYPNGAVYIYQTGFFRQSESSYGNNTLAYIMPMERSFDIDNELDFSIAEYVAGKIRD